MEEGQRGGPRSALSQYVNTSRAYHHTTALGWSLTFSYHDPLYRVWLARFGAELGHAVPPSLLPPRDERPSKVSKRICLEKKREVVMSDDDVEHRF